ncbi:MULTISPECIES: DNA-methyltransferase [Paenibacillus]|uniref:Methyltransferase n=2 Tax=Paenibacillus TaxID=44249 RepID=A0A0D7WXS9_9BACL|nr:MULTISPECIES: site-specific DNA-methyltransferase [Paenibacillus]KJD44001.1 DNA methyltransferase [Paenibacillus terrae]QNR65190.1 site-specific DNA-methyltransferase [Paenibacillus peoriae]
MNTFNIVKQMDCLVGMNAMQAESVDLIITSPPYNLNKSYEKKTALEAYLFWQREIIQACERVLKPGGSIAYQVGSYVDDGKVYPLDCLLFATFIEFGFTPRNRIVWHFESGLHCKNRLSGRHETVLWFTKGDNYTFNLDSIRVPQKYPGKKHYKGDKKGELSGNPLGKNPGDVWIIPNVKHNHPEKTNHECQFPLDLIRPIIKALSHPNNLVLDPFMGSGTVAVAATQLNRKYIGFELLESYIKIIYERLSHVSN